MALSNIGNGAFSARTQTLQSEREKFSVLQTSVYDNQPHGSEQQGNGSESSRGERKNDEAADKNFLQSIINKLMQENKNLLESQQKTKREYQDKTLENMKEIQRLMVD